MKKYIYLLPLLAIPAHGYPQSAVDALRLTQTDMKGTARFMGMGGAFGALGADLSTLSQNPAGIGVYRQQEIGFTLDLDCQKSKAESQGLSSSDSQTKFLLNNIGFVLTLRLPSNSVPNLNVGFTYNKDASFNRIYSGSIPHLTNSLSNYIASGTDGYSEGQLLGEDSEGTYDPYNPPSGVGQVPWLPILGYSSFLTSIKGNPDDNMYQGQWYEGKTAGSGSFAVQEQGGIDSYNLALGGNIANVVFWGMDFGFTHLNYTLTPSWSEDLTNAYVEGADGMEFIKADWKLGNYYNCTGNGFNYKLGLIFKPIQELRIGFAFHTPTWYSLTETFRAGISYRYNGEMLPSYKYTNDNMPATNDVNLRTPWKIIASVAGVIGNNLILSADYEWNGVDHMKYSVPNSNDYGYYDDPYDYPWYDPWYAPASGTRATGNNFIAADPFANTNQQIREYTRSTNTLRIGAEYRVTRQFSVRAGYSYVSSPVKESTRTSTVVTAGTIPNYRLDNSTNYLSFGLGYKIQKFYIDLAYVWKHMTSEYYAYSSAAGIAAQKADLTFDNHQVVLSAGFKF